MPRQDPVLGSDGYSINPDTRRVRSRIAKFTPERVEQHKIHTREYGALFQACNRHSRRDDYKQADLVKRRQILMATLENIIENRFVLP